MALKTKSRNAELPEGAVLVSEEEALKYQRNLVKRWPSESEVLCLKFGSVIAGFVTALSSGLISNHFRVFFRTDFKIIAITVIPGLGVPFYFSKTSTDTTVTDNILLMKVQCPLCMTAKFASEQFFSSLLFPSLYAFSAHAMYADLKGTYSFPGIRVDAPKFWKETFRAYKSGAKTFQIVGLLQAVVILFLPYWQNRELHYITSKSEEKEDPELLLS